MKVNYLSIGVKDSNIRKVETTLIQLDVFNNVKDNRQLLNVDITIEDLRDDYLIMTKFLMENNLADENPFFNDFDINPYGLKVDFNFMKDFKHLNILEPVVFIIGQQISFYLKTECIVMFDNMQMPIGMFNNGILVEVFEKYNELFFENKVWKPKR